MGENKLLSLPLAFAVVVVQLRLDGGGDEHRRFVALRGQQGEQVLGEAPVALVKFIRILGTVHARQMEHKVRPGGVVRQKLFWRVDVEQKQVVPAFIAKLGDKVFSHKTARPCN